VLTKSQQDGRAFITLVETRRPCAIRDPIHEWIKMSNEEKALIDQPLVQRLRHTCQLSGTDLVFPGGVHNRFSHVLGVMHTAGEFARVLYPDNPHRVQVSRPHAVPFDADVTVADVDVISIFVKMQGGSSSRVVTRHWTWSVLSCIRLCSLRTDLPRGSPRT